MRITAITKGRFKKHALSVILLVLISVALFYNSFENSFIWDGKAFIAENKNIRSLKNIPVFFTPRYWKQLLLDYPDQESHAAVVYRPVSMATFALDYYLWRLNAAGYHLTNLLVQILNVVLIYFLIYILAGQAGDKEFASGRKGFPAAIGRQVFLSLPFLTAAFFATHPIHTESITWIKNRSDPLALLFFLASSLFFIRHLRKAEGRPAVFSYAMAALCFILALLSKAVAVTFPALFACYVLCLLPPGKQKQALLRTLPFLGAAAIFLAFQFIFLKRPPPAESIPALPLYRHFLTVLKSIGYYAGLLIFPAELNADRTLHIPKSLFEPAVYLSAALLLFALIIIIRVFTLRGRAVAGVYARMLCFALLWFFFTILPASNIVFLFSRPIAEQRAYVPSLGFCLVLALGIIRLSSFKLEFLGRDRARTLAVLITVFILGFYSVTTVRRNFDWRSPLTLWSKTVDSSPQSGRAHNNLGNVYLKKDLYDEAIKEYKQALRFSPRYGEFHYNLGYAYEKKGLYDKAMKEYKEALRLYPDNIKAHNNLGNIYEKKRLYDEAIKEYRQALRLNPGSSKFHYNLGNIYDAKGLYDEAIKEYRQALRLDPANADARNNLGNVYGAKGLHDEAIKEYQEAIRLDPANADAHHNLGGAYHARGLYDEAIKEYQEAIRLDPANADAHNILGNIYDKKSSYDEAIKEYREAIRLDPANADAHNNLGNAYKKNNLHDLAEKEYRQAIRLDPANAAAHYNLGNLYYARGLYDEAEKEYRQAIRLDPANAVAHNNLGNVYYEKRFYDQAIKEYQQALRLDRGNAAAHYNLGNVYYAEGRYDEAINKYKDALRLKPGSREIHYNLGNLYYAKGLYDEAARCFRRAAELDAGHIGVRKGLALCYYEMKLFPQAKKEWERVLQIDPDDASAVDYLENLKRQGY